MYVFQVAATKLPHYQLNHFVSSLLDGLTDIIPVNLTSLGELLVSFFQIKGGELYHHINDILGELLSNILFHCENFFSNLLFILCFLYMMQVCESMF